MRYSERRKTRLAFCVLSVIYVKNKNAKIILGIYIFAENAARNRVLAPEDVCVTASGEKLG